MKNLFKQIPQKLRINPDIDFLALTLITILVNLPYFLNYVVILTDTYQALNIFENFYESFYFLKDLPGWIPYGAYGAGSVFQIIVFMTPTDFFSMLVGKLLNIESFYFLFTLSQFLKQLIQLLGIYLLARELFSNRYVVLFVSLAVIVSNIWIVHITYSIYLTYLLPLVLFFLVRFFKRSEIIYLWYAGITLIIWAAGTNYMQITIIFSLIIFSLIMALLLKPQPGFILNSFYNFKSIIAFVLLIILASLFMLLAVDAFSNVFLPPYRGRSDATGAVELSLLLQHRSDITLKNTIIRSLGLSTPPLKAQTDVGLYLGILPVILFIYGVLKVRNNYFYAFLGAWFLTYWLSLLGVFTIIIYYVYPILQLAKYLDWTHVLLKIYGIICAGYGLQALLDRYMAPNSEEQIRFTPKLRTSFYLGLLFILFIKDLFRLNWFDQYNIKTLLMRLGFYVIPFVLYDYFWLQKKEFSTVKSGFNPLALILVAGLFFDILSFQFMFWKQYKPSGMDPAVTDTLVKLNYQSKRVPDPLNDFQRERMTYDMYNVSYQYAHFDPCDPNRSYERATQFYDKRVGDLITIIPDTSSPLFKHLVSCGVPKLRFVESPILVKSDLQAMGIFINQNLNTPIDVIVLPNSREVADEAVEVHAEHRLKVTGFNVNSITAEVEVNGAQGSWLVYSDAYHPDWRAFIDGVETPIMKANLAFKSIYVPKGSHTISFKIQKNPILSVYFYKMATTVIVYLTWYLILGFGFSLQRKSTI